MPWYTLYDYSPLPSDSNNSGANTTRQAIPVAGYNGSAPATGSQIRITVQSSSTFVAGWDKVYIGHAAASGDAYDFDGTQVQVLFSGSASGSIAAGGGTLVSDAVTYAFDKTKPLVIGIHHTGTANTRGYGTNAAMAASFVVNRSAAGVDEAATTDITAFAASTGRLNAFPKVEVFDATSSGNITLSAAAGSYAITGAATGLGPGYQLTGSAASFVTATSGTTILTAAAGSYGLTGTAAGLAYSATLTASAGSYALTGTAAGLGLGYRIAGTDAAFVIGVAGATTFPASAGSYTLTGSPVTFLGVEPIAPPPTSYTGGASRGRMIRKRRKREEEEEPIPVIGSTPVAEVPPPSPIPPQPGLMAGVKASPRTVLRSPPDEDEDEIALLLELLS